MLKTPEQGLLDYKSFLPGGVYRLALAIYLSPSVLSVARTDLLMFLRLSIGVLDNKEVLHLLDSVTLVGFSPFIR